MSARGRGLAKNIARLLLLFAYDAPEPCGVLEQYSAFGHVRWRNSLVWGEDLGNASIVKRGRSGPHD